MDLPWTVEVVRGNESFVAGKLQTSFDAAVLAMGLQNYGVQPLVRWRGNILYPTTRLMSGRSVPWLAEQLQAEADTLRLHPR